MVWRFETRPRGRWGYPSSTWEPEKQPYADKRLSFDGMYPVRAKMTMPFWINVPFVGLGSPPVQEPANLHCPKLDLE
jgi:hypothetical protein